LYRRSGAWSVLSAATRLKHKHDAANPSIVEAGRVSALVASNYDRPSTSSSRNGIHLVGSVNFRSAKNKQKPLDLIAKF
jgi:hypothetical protein